MSLKTILKEKELWILVLIVILYFHRPLFLGETLFFRDIFSTFLPQKQLLVDFIHSRELPLWNPYQHGGQPYWANIGNTVLYPFNLLYLFLPLLKAFNWNIVLHLLFCSTFTYLFTRVIGFRSVSSLIAGVVYGFCGYTLSLINLLGIFWALPYLPLSLLFWHLYLLEGHRKWFVITVMISTLRVFSAGPEINVITMLTLLGWSLFYTYPRVSIPRRFILWVLLGVFTLGIASIQLVPTLEMVGLSSRGTGSSYGMFSKWSLHPRRLLEIVSPGFLGQVDTLFLDVKYWGKYLIDGKIPLIISIYFGGIALALACFAGLSRRHTPHFPFRIRIFLFSLFTISLLLSLGRFLPFFHIVYRYVPFISLFRFPIKFLMMGIFPLALLTGYASELHFGGSPGVSEQQNKMWAPSWKMLTVLWGIAAILLAVTLLFWFLNDFANTFQHVFFYQSGGDVIRYGVRKSLAHACLFWLLLTLLYQYRKITWRRWQHWLLAGILMVDLLSAGKSINPSAPEEFFTWIPSLVQTVHSEIDNGRLFRTENPDPSKIVLQVPSNNIFGISPDSIIWWWRWDLEMLESNLAASYRIPVIFHLDFDGLAQRHLVKLRAVLSSVPWEKKLQILSASGVTIILTAKEISLPEVELITPVRHPNSNVTFFLYRNNTAASRVEFVTDRTVVNSDEDAVNMMISQGFDPRKSVVLQKPEKETAPVDESPESCYALQLDIVEKRANTHSASYSVSNSCRGYLVFSEPYYPGWQVSIDGKSSPILRANYAFSAVFLEPGEHNIERVYRPNSVWVGMLSSLIFCGILALITYKGWFLEIR